MKRYIQPSSEVVTLELQGAVMGVSAKVNVPISDDTKPADKGASVLTDERSEWGNIWE